MANSKIKDGVYHYTECGLDYVFLANGWERVATEYGEGTRIEDVDGLHLCIARHIVERQSATMSGREFRFLRVFLGLSQKTFGSMMGPTEQAVAKWEKRSSDVPKWANNFMRALFRELVDGNADLASALEQISEAERKIDGLRREIAELHLRLAKHNESEEWVEEPAHAADALERMRWVPAGERLPAGKDRLWLVRGIFDGQAGYWYSIARFVGDEDEPRWMDQDCDRDGYPLEWTYEVRDWMPLPGASESEPDTPEQQ